ncbi:AAA family ATPase [Winogradskyella sp.]|uniref:AAA family ATPase n=1 Tax=Winogradskyella sp. TaxID=1883156 RepID=UPI0026281839|nr:AAA family ATPase [Winogradskyella sp.]
MRLAYCKIHGFKRFQKASVNLDRKLIAFVGPNESGKSSFFEVLASTENQDEFQHKQLSRDENYDNDHDVIELCYSIEEDDLKKLKELNGVGNPKFYSRYKAVNGKTTYSFSAEIKRNIELRKTSSGIIKSLIKSSYYKSKLEKHIIAEGDYAAKEPEYTFLDYSDEIIQELHNSDENLTTETIDYLNQYKNDLEDFIETLPKSRNKRPLQLLESLKDLMIKESQEHPEQMFMEYLSSKRPKIVFFDKENRDLKETYSFSEIENPPPSLRNLFSVAEIENKKLMEAIQNGDSGLQESIIEDGNLNLKSKYNSYWNQADVFPRIKLENNEIRILLRFVNSYNNISDRSDGLKQFIALLAFALNNDKHNELILLIDEAEIHLHYAAQADIVELFEKQKIVNSIFYSTHSAGCLPSDLGTGIRVIQPIKENQKETTKSEIKNSIWSNTAGFSPILLAMGANIIAFSLTRKALIAEGPSDTILLPRLLREATLTNELDFQIAPGLASISIEKCKELDLEASRVSFIVDGDNGGEKIKKKLIEAKFRPNKIISLPKNHILEDFIDKEVLLKATNSIISKFQENTLNLKPSNIPNNGSIKFLEDQCKVQGIKFPGKVLIAEELVSLGYNELILKSNNRNKLLKVFDKITKSLDLS